MLTIHHLQVSQSERIVWLCEELGIDYTLKTYERHPKTRLAQPDFADYVYWLHFSNGNLQPLMGRNMILGRLDLPADNATLVATRGRLDRALRFIEDRLGDNTWLAGAEFTAADVMTVFSLTTMRNFFPLDLGPWPNIRGYLARIGERPAYRRAMAKGDPGMTPMLA